MRHTTLYFFIAFFLTSCATVSLPVKGQAQNKLILQKRNDGSVISYDYLDFIRDGFKVPRRTDTSSVWLRADSLGMLLFDSTHQRLWLRSTATGFVHKWSGLATTTDITAINFWQRSNGKLYPLTTTDSLGVGGAPSFPFDVQDGSGRFYFDGTRTNLTDGQGNILIGGLTGLLLGSNANNIAIGNNALRLAPGADNTAVGAFALASVTGNRNTAMGVNSLAATDSADNTAIGDKAGVNNYGAQNTSVGSLSGNFQQVATATINNSEIVPNSTTLTGTGTGTFISANSLVTGTTYSFSIHFNGTPPANYGTTTDIYFHGIVTNSNTLTLTEGTFSTSGSGNFDLAVFDKQRNSIAIGYNVQTPSSNYIKIGNSNNTTLQVGTGNFIVDLTDVPSDQQVLTWVTSAGKAQWQSLGGGGGGVGSVSGITPINVSGGTSDAVVSIANAAADGTTKGAAAFNASDFNATSGVVTIDYNNGQAASGSLKGFLSFTDWNTFNDKQDLITGAATSITSANLTASRILTSNGSGKVIASAVTAATLAFLDATSSVQTQLDGKASATLANGKIFIGNVSNVATAQTMSGDATISNAGVLTIKNSGVTAGTYANANVTINAQGIVTAAADGSGGGGGTGTVTTVTGTSPISITSDPLVTPNVTIANAKADGSTKGAAWFSVNDFNDNGSGGISFDYTNAQKATTLVPGLMTSAQVTTLNSAVQNTRTITAGTGLTGTGDLSADRTISLNSLAGFISAGTNVTITGVGTIASPFVIASSGGGGGAGTVQSFAFTNGGGFTGTVTNSTTTPTLSLTLQNAAADGATKGQATFAAADFNAATGVISLDYTNGQKATTTTTGFLSSTDWTAFNAKQAAITGGATTITAANLTTGRALISDGAGKVAVSAVTSTQLGFLGTTISDVQTQIDSKEPAVTYPFFAVTSSATPTVNCNNGYHEKMTLTANSTFTFSNFVNGHILILKVTQDATGGRTVNLSGLGTITWLNSSGSGTAATIATGANKISFISIINDNGAYAVKVSNN